MVKLVKVFLVFSICISMSSCVFTSKKENNKGPDFGLLDGVGKLLDGTGKLLDGTGKSLNEIAKSLNGQEIEENRTIDTNGNNREDLFGVWKATDESLKRQLKGDDKNIIFSFQLNENSTAIICRNDFTQDTNEGTWLWSIEKKFGNNNFGISFYCDVILNVDYTSSLGLLLEEKSGALYLKAGEYEFKKMN